MPKWLKIVVALLLLPLCLGAFKALWILLTQTGGAESFWVAALAGAACWIVVFLMLPKPMWVYVLGHELTHALWAWLFGGRVRRFKVSSKGGHVILDKTNFLIVLAPYFFPLYAVMVVLIFAAGHLIWDWSPYIVWFHLLLGAAYLFHVTLTWHILKTRQTDITSQGFLFSGVVIFLGNALVLLLGLSPLLGQKLTTVLGWWMTATGGVLRRLGGLLG
jgi:hypothetical protein